VAARKAAKKNPSFKRTPAVKVANANIPELVKEGEKMSAKKRLLQPLKSKRIRLLLSVK